jgi:hypothetical protein
MDKEYEEKKKLFSDAIALKKTSRVPNLSNFYTWKILDSEFTLREAMYDYEKMEKLVRDFHNRYNFDAYMDLGSRNPLRVTDALGGGHHEVDDEKESINYIDHVLMTPDEYPEMKQDLVKFYWTKAFARKYPETTLPKLKQAALELMAYGQFVQHMTDVFVQEYKCPTVFNYNAVALMPFETLHSNLRGIKEISLDIRRHGKAIQELTDVMFATETYPAISAALETDTSSYVCDTYTALLGYAILSYKQFEMFYWPHLKKIIDLVVKKNKTLFIFCESTMLRFVDFFKEIPSGHVVLHLEEDDIFEIRKLLPNVCVAGGMNSTTLGYGTVKECVDYAKHLIDDLGDGYIFTQNKMMSFRSDCKRENLIAVNDFVRNYKP